MAELRTLARPYAKAAFERAVDINALSVWAEELQLFARLVSSDKVKQLISSPANTAVQKTSALLELAGDDIKGETKNFVALLAENKRLDLLPDIYILFDQLKAERESTINVVVNSAFEFDAGLEQKLAESLKNKLQREIKVETAIDKSLIGGALIKAGDVVIDGSVKGRLAKLAEAMNS